MATAQPPLTSPTTFSFGQRASVKKTSLNSESPEIILIGRTSTPGWSMGHEQERDALVLGGVGVGAGEHEDPVGEVPGRGPDLLPVDHPLVAVEHGPAPEVAEVGAGVGLGVALAPDVLAGEDPREEVALLLVGAPLQERVADHLDAEDVVGAARRARPPGANSSARITCSSAVSPRRRTRWATTTRGAVVVQRVAPLRR